MALSIRLARGGSKKRPYYRIIVADARSPRDGKYLEKIGTYNPLLAKDDDKRVQLDADRARHWLSVGAQPTDRVARFLDVAGVRERASRENPNKGKPGEKATERAEERVKKLEVAQAAAAEAAAAPPPPEPVVELEVAEPTSVAEVVEAAEPDTASQPALPVEPTSVEPAQMAETPAATDLATTDSAEAADKDAAVMSAAEKDAAETTAA